MMFENGDQLRQCSIKILPVSLSATMSTIKDLFSLFSHVHCPPAASRWWAWPPSGGCWGRWSLCSKPASRRHGAGTDANKRGDLEIKTSAEIELHLPQVCYRGEAFVNFPVPDSTNKGCQSLKHTSGILWKFKRNVGSLLLKLQSWNPHITDFEFKYKAFIWACLHENIQQRAQCTSGAL